MAAAVRTQNLAELAKALESRAPEDILSVAFDLFDPDIAFATAFGAEGMVLLELLHRVRPRAKVIYIDTQFFFRPTYELIEKARARYPFQWVRLVPELTPEQQAQRYGPELYRRDPEACCRMRKVEPLRKYFAEARLQAWVTSLRREQSPLRADTPVVHRDPVFGLVKFNPLVRWTWRQVREFLRRNRVPYNVLHDHGYPSIGCWPCTRPVRPGEDFRAGRWSGTPRTECGLHR